VPEEIEALGQLTPVRPDGFELEAVAYQLSGRHIDDLDALRKWLPASNRVHQFQDGNGRLSRVLKTLLLIIFKIIFMLVFYKIN
jgi:fido (protein-threonine AMPylation protein)